MNINLDKRQQAVTGAVLIGLGLVWWLELWWLLIPAALVAAGAAAYIQRRAMGRVAEAVQGGLWGVSLGVLWLLGFVWPGILFLAGASILLRGREHELDARVQLLLGRVRRPHAAIQPTRAQQVPLETVDSAAVGETTRLN